MEQEQFFAWSNVDKSGWGPGPWLQEPDKQQWVDSATGLDCLIVRNDAGGLCGYVGVPEQHPLYGVSYMDLMEINVHGGLTFSDKCEGNICHVAEREVWWLGFDCGHWNDLLPAMRARLRAVPSLTFWDRDYVYRNVAYVEAECAELAKQIMAIDPIPKDEMPHEPDHDDCGVKP